MAVSSEVFETEHGDTIKATLLDDELFLTVTYDADDTTPPTARLTLEELGGFRELLRRLGETARATRFVGS